MKAYLAGPDVFRPDALEWAAQARALCRRHGVEALVPLDGEALTAEGIYFQNVAMIRAADGVLANLDAFRGAEPDSGTSFEVGFALALGKPVVGYVSTAGTTPERVARWQGGELEEADGKLIDRDGLIVEDFGLPLNLMLAVPARIVVGGLEEALVALLSGRAG
ncbi:nucleoside 2-deoxyribosyltransferase [Uliginosibacterium sp. 31-16]|uniref:nucleoside 2-deoxyribosyltransferase n=1 Tax=Uliginosibacterium sp. 31-16 TaxID=3068315 RepID=UPI00273F6AC3|nr:nucleoside 2-deoxyribosyltransferase [Uliginosibacterium sp. 31-16]MDP5239337.1 nucleoside 2-deoxyribosyltransferase [Uliginosibacterium sp. 31-16]